MKNTQLEARTHARPEIPAIVDAQYRIQRLSRALLQGDGLSAFLALLESLLGNPAALPEADSRYPASPGVASVLAKSEELKSSIFYNTPSGALCYDGRGGMKTPCSIMFLGMESGTVLPSRWRGRCAEVHMPCACCARRPLTLRESAGRFRMFIFWSALLSFFIIHRAKFA